VKFNQPRLSYLDHWRSPSSHEVWAVPPTGLASILLKEPPGLCIGLVTLADGRSVLGVLGEAYLCATGTEITQFGGWRAVWQANRDKVTG
jgi:hypothetical protein